MDLGAAPEEGSSQAVFCWVPALWDEGKILGSRESPKQKKKPLSHSTQCLPDHTWNTLFSLVLTKIWKRWRGSRKGQRWLKYWEAAARGKVEITVAVWPLEKKVSEEILSPYFSIWRVATKKMETPFLQRVTWESHGKDKGYKLFLGKFLLVTGRKHFTIRTNSNWNNVPRGALDSPMSDISTVQLDRVLGHLLWTVLSPRKVGPDDSRDLFKHEILWFHFLSHPCFLHSLGLC